MPTIAEAMSRGDRQRVREAVKSAPVDKACVYVPLTFKMDEEDDLLTFEGFANTVHVDRSADIVRPSAFRSTLGAFLKNNPQVFYNHDWSVSVGGILEAKVMKEGLWVRGYVQPAEDEKGEPLTGSWGEFIRMIRGQVSRGQLRTMSVGFRILKTKEGSADHPITGDKIAVREILQLELFEISLVTVPANRESVVAAKAYYEERLGSELAESLVHDISTNDTELVYPIQEKTDVADPNGASGPQLRLVSLKTRRPTEQVLTLVKLEDRDDE